MLPREFYEQQRKLGLTEGKLSLNGYNKATEILNKK